MVESASTALTEATSRADTAEGTLNQLKESIRRRDERVRQENDTLARQKTEATASKDKAFLEGINQEVRVYVDRMIEAYPNELTESKTKLYSQRTLLEAQRLVLGIRHGTATVR